MPSLRARLKKIEYFIGRRQKQSNLPSSIEGIPILPVYKYLGLRLNSKLTMDPQINSIKTRITDLKRRLRPFLLGAETDTRKKQIFVLPLCEFLLPL